MREWQYESGHKQMCIRKLTMHNKPWASWQKEARKKDKHKTKDITKHKA